MKKHFKEIERLIVLWQALDEHDAAFLVLDESFCVQSEALHCAVFIESLLGTLVCLRHASLEQIYVGEL